MLLAIDTATRMLSLALHDGRRIRAELSWESANRHTVELTPAIVDLCRRAAISVHDVTHIAVAQGPGSFSGLRAGIGAAKGLAMALAVPLIAVPTLDIVAAAQQPFAGELLAVAQVGRGRVCAGRYEWDAASRVWQSIDSPQIMAWGALIGAITSVTLIAGEIDDAARLLLDAALAAGSPLQIASPAWCVRRAAFLADLAWARADISADPALVVPLYVNQPGIPHS